MNYFNFKYLKEKNNFLTKYNKKISFFNYYNIIFKFKRG